MGSDEVSAVDGMVDGVVDSPTDDSKKTSDQVTGPDPTDSPEGSAAASDLEIAPDDLSSGDTSPARTNLPSASPPSASPPTASPPSASPPTATPPNGSPVDADADATAAPVSTPDAPQPPSDAADTPWPPRDASDAVADANPVEEVPVEPDPVDARTDDWSQPTDWAVAGADERADTALLPATPGYDDHPQLRDNHAEADHRGHPDNLAHPDDHAHYDDHAHVDDEDEWADEYDDVALFSAIFSAPSLALAAFVFALTGLLGGMIPESLPYLVQLDPSNGPAYHVRIVGLIALGFAIVAASLGLAAMLRSIGSPLRWPRYLGGAAVLLALLIALQSVLLIVLAGLAPTQGGLN
ncbi:MAG: hypothetical protein ACRDT4_12410 [Micromonosporaceae bacterium]